MVVGAEADATLILTNVDLGALTAHLNMSNVKTYLEVQFVHVYQDIITSQVNAKVTINFVLTSQFRRSI